MGGNLGIYLSRQAYLPLIMYLVIRCPGCKAFSYVDRYQRWKLCHVCGATININSIPIYLEVRDHHEAESVVSQLETFLHETGRKDLSGEELQRLRESYLQWLRNQT